MNLLVRSLAVLLVNVSTLWATCESYVHIIASSNGDYVYGTGVIAHAGPEGVYVVTAKHVVEGATTCQVVLFENGEHIGYISSSHIIQHPTYDVAVIYAVSSPYELSMAPIRRYGARDGEVVFAVGRLAGGNLRDDPATPMGGHPVSRKVQAVTIGAFPSHIDSVEAFGLSKNAWPGCSGGPVYDENGLVIGIVVHRSFRRDQAECIGIGPIREILHGEQKYEGPQPIKNNGGTIKACANPMCKCTMGCKCSPCRCQNWKPAPIPERQFDHIHEYNSAGICPRCPPRTPPASPRYAPAPPPPVAPVPNSGGDWSFSVTTVFAVVGGVAVSGVVLYFGLRYAFPWVLAQILIGLVKFRPVTKALLEMDRVMPDWEKKTLLDMFFPKLKEEIEEAKQANGNGATGAK